MVQLRTIETKTMNIQVFGTGCAKCKNLFEATKKAALESGLQESAVEYVTDMASIVEAGIMSTPALVINDVVIAAGKVPSTDDIKSVIAQQKG
ncbi:MAG: thioredoxin family protein [bacterium]